MKKDRTGLRLNLLGGFEVRLASGPVVTLPTRKAQALLAYLAVRPDRTHPRDKLAGLLWADRGDAQARDSLRHTLVELRKVFRVGSPGLIAEGHGVGLDSAAIEVDVVRFETLVKTATPEDLDKAAELYQGDFLHGFVLREPSFEEWLVAERERLRELALGALRQLVEQQVKKRASEPAIRSALRLLALDATQEVAHRALMRLYVQQGRRAAALRQYQTCVAVLQRELGAEPEVETRQLYQEIVRRREQVQERKQPPGARINSMPSPAAPASPGQALAGRSEPGTADTPLIGRDTELATLRNMFAEAQWGRGRVVAIVGEAGVGKSWLVAEQVRRASEQDARVLVGRCYESEQILPFGPWVDAFRAGHVVPKDPALLALEPAWRAELARLFPEITGAGVPAGSDNARRLFEGMTYLLGALSANQPVLLVLEDMHWADEMSLRLLSFLGRRVHPWPVFVVVTAREEEIVDAEALRQALAELRGEGHFAELALSPLSRTDTSALVRSISVMSSESQTMARLEEQVWAASEGNPFVIVEMVNALREGTKLEQPTNLSVPERVRRVIARRLDRLDDRSRQLLSVAAVIGREFDFALLRQASGLTDHAAAAGVEDLVRRRMLHGVDEGFDFTHDRIREVVYAGLLPPRRKLLHGDVAVALEALTGGALDPPAGALGLHYRHAEVPRKAQVWLTTAGDMAARKYASGPANHYYEAALALADNFLDRALLHERIGDMHMLQWSGDAGAIHHRRALEMWQAAGAADASIAARLYAKLAEAPTRWRGAFKTPPAEDEVIGWIDAGLDLLHDDRSIEKARLLMARAALPNLTGRRDEADLHSARASAEEALPIMETLGTARDVSAVLDGIGNVHMNLADYPGALACHLRRRDLGARIEDRAELIDIGCMLSQAYSALGRYPDAVREAQAAADLGEIGLGGWHVHALLWRTWAHFASDRWDHATQSFEEFLRVWESYDRIYQTFVGELFLIQAVVSARCGEDDKATALARQAQDYTVRRMLHLPALLLMAQGRVADARVVLEELASGRGRLIPVVHAHLTEIQARSGDAEVAAAAEQVLALATRAAARKEIAQIHRALGLALGSAGDASTAAEHFAEALQRYQELGTRWEVAQTLRDWGRAELTSQDSSSRDRARERLAAALAIFQEFGDRRSAEDVRTMLK
jgi:DNA-binding SARP family transcriptional activator